MSDGNKSIVTNRRQQILSVIAGDVELPRVSRMYVLCLFVTATAVLLLPLLYFVLTVLFIGGLYSFFHNQNIILAGWSPLCKWTFSGLVGFIGASCVLGLIKPLFARSLVTKHPHPLPRSDEPLLYDYVNRLCDSIGVDRPVSIKISGDLNAAAEMSKGWLNPFGRREMVLHLGLPLVAGLSLREFTGIIAHELGHFTQRTAMRLDNIIRRTIVWLTRAAFERDAVDNWLRNQCESRGIFALPCYFARAIVWVTRWGISVFALVGSVISSLMSREMEYNADRCQIRVVGTRTHAASFWKLRQLSVAQQMSVRDLMTFWDEGRLPDDFIELVVANLEFITPKVKKKLKQMMIDEKTKLFDNHPSDCDRIEAAERDGSQGIYRSDVLPARLSATVLFKSFDQLSKDTTNQYYQTLIDQPIRPKMLFPVKKLLERQTIQIEAAKALRRYFQTEIPLMRPLPIAPHSAEAEETPLEVAKRVKACRDRMLKELAEYKRLTPRYRAAEDTLFELTAFQTLLQAGLSIEGKDQPFPDANSKAVSTKQKRAKEAVETLAQKLLPFEMEAGSRLALSLYLLNVPGVIKKIDGGDVLKYEVDELLPHAEYVNRLMGELPTLRIVYLRLLALWERLSDTVPDEQAMASVLDQMVTLRTRLISIQLDMGDRLYPFDHAKAETTLKQYALPAIPAKDDLGGLVQMTDHMQSRLVTIQARLFSRLAHAAERVEEAIGLPPLPEPVDDGE